MHLDQKDKSKKVYPIKNFLIDLRFMTLVPKIEQIIGRRMTVASSLHVQPKGNEGFSEYRFARFLEVQNEMFGKDVEKQEEIRKCIDYQFNKNVWLLKMQFYVFLFGFLLPFQIQMLKPGVIKPTQVVFLMNVCMGTQIFFLLQEFWQLKMMKFSYFFNAFNYVQWFLFYLFYMYYKKRVKYCGSNVFPSELEDEEKEWLQQKFWKDKVMDVEFVKLKRREDMMFWIVSNTLIILISSVYLIFYARVFESFGLFVRMCKHSLASMNNFVIFLIFWLVLFAYLFVIAGNPIDKSKDSEDYAYLDSSSQILIHTLRNTLGDLQLPDYEFWKTLVKEDLAEQAKKA